jgi:hypothetical protein
MKEIVTLTDTERREFFDRFKHRAIPGLQEMKTTLEKRRESEKVILIDQILAIRTADTRQLKAITRQLEREEKWMEFDLANSLLEKHLGEITAEKAKAKQAARAKKLEDRTVRKHHGYVRDNSTLIALIAAARQDSGLRTQLLCIVRLDSFNRSSLINTFLGELQLKGAPKEFRNAIGLLVDNDVANEVRKALAEQVGHEPG